MRRSPVSHLRSRLSIGGSGILGERLAESAFGAF
jgi:hypothetical protein